MTDRTAPVAPLIAALAVMLFGLATGWAALASSLPGAPHPAVVVADVAAGWSFAVVGAALWRRYPENRIGALALAVGLASFLPDMRWFETALTWTAGSVLADIHLVLLAWLILAFPTGRLDRRERVFVTGLVVYFVTLAIGGHLFQNPIPGCGQCPPNLLLVRLDPGLNDLIWGSGQVVNLLAVGILVGLIALEWTRSTVAGRRALAPVIWALGPIGLTLIVSFLEPLLGLGNGWSMAILLAERLALIVFPIALGLGMVRARLDQVKAIDLARSVESALEPGELESLIRDALADPSARLGVWSESSGRLIDGNGMPLERTDTLAESEIFSGESERLGSILHDPAVDDALVDAVGATVTLALRNEKLRAELRRRLIEVEESRGRIAAAAMNERLRIERDLHDGAQQGLLALGASLGTIRARCEGEVANMLDEAIASLRVVIDELRELARGVHPPILSERGLGAAVETLAERSPIPVELRVTATRCAPEVEAAAYFMVAEALANTVRHAEASHIDVSIVSDDDGLLVVVSDDGRGGAEVASGSGLQGLTDRFEALGGQVRLTKPRQGGTTLEGTLPCG